MKRIFGLFLCFGPLLLAACGDSTGPRRSALVFSTETAAPFSWVGVEGLPASHQREGAPVRVGAVETMLHRSEAAAEWGFVIPPMARANVDVTILDESGQRPLKGKLAIVAVAFVGGTPTAAVDTMRARLGEVVTSLAYLESTLSPSREDTAFTAFTRGFAEQAAALEAQIDALPAAEQAEFAAFYSESGLDEAIRLTLLVLADQQTGRVSYGREFATSSSAFAAGGQAETATAIAQRCQSRIQIIDELGRVQAGLDIAAFGLAVITLGTAAPVAAGIVGATSLLTKLLIGYAKLDAYLPVPGSLTLSPAPTRLRGGDGGMVNLEVEVTNATRARFLNLPLPASTDDFLNELEAADRDAIISHLTGQNFIRNFFAGKLQDFGIALAFYGLDRFLLGDTSYAGLQRPGRIPVLSEGLTLSASPVGSFQAEPGNFGPVPFSVPAGASSGTVRLSGRRASTTATCAIQSNDAPDAANPLKNSFEVADSVGPMLAFDTTGTAPMAVPQNSSRSANLTVRNRGDVTVQDMTVALGEERNGQWTPWEAPAGASVGVRLNTYTLRRGAAARITVTVAATPDAATAPFIVPVTVTSENANGVTLALRVDVESQLASIRVNRMPSYLQIYDYGQQDGDSIRIVLNGSVLVPAMMILNRPTRISLPYRAGRNTLQVTALNEGRLSPNTAAIIWGDVVDGEASQNYGLRTNEVVRMVIEVDPNATANADRVVPKVRYNDAVERDQVPSAHRAPKR